MYRLGRGTTTMPCFFFLVCHRVPLPRLLCQRQPRLCIMCCYCFGRRCSSTVLMLLLCMCGYCPVLLLLFLLLLLCLEYVSAANPREHGKYASQPLSMICLRIPAEIRTNLLRKLYEYRLAIGIFFYVSAEVSCQRSIRMGCTCTLYCWWLLL